MARRNTGFLSALAGLPWPVGIVTGLVLFVLVRYGIAWYFAGQANPLSQGLASAASSGAFAPLAWLVLILCWAAAGASWVAARRRSQLLDAQSDLDSVSALSWQEFEMLVGEAFRRRGYRVEEAGLGGKDGGVDLVLRKDGRTELVQCKRWKQRQVGVQVVREMYGLLSHHGADAVKIVCVGQFTPDAVAFAAGKPIQLTSGNALVDLIREARDEVPVELDADPPNLEPVAASSPDCPTCGTRMIPRKNRRTDEPFWGCATYPRCRGTRPA